MRRRKQVNYFSGKKPSVNIKYIENEIYDLFDLSPLTVTEIAKSYGICRLTVYRIARRKEGLVEDKH